MSRNMQIHVLQGSSLYGMPNFLRHMYFLYLNNKVAWDYAEALCQEAGGHFAQIDNLPEKNYVEALGLND